VREHDGVGEMMGVGKEDRGWGRRVGLGLGERMGLGLGERMGL